MLVGWQEKRTLLAACSLIPDSSSPKPSPRDKHAMECLQTLTSFTFTSQIFAPRDQGSQFKGHWDWVKPLVKLRKKVPWHGNSIDPWVKFKHRHKLFKPLMCDSGVMPQRTLGLHERLVKRWSPLQQQRYRGKFYTFLFIRCWLCIFFFSLDYFSFSCFQGAGSM